MPGERWAVSFHIGDVSEHSQARDDVLDLLPRENGQLVYVKGERREPLANVADGEDRVLAYTAPRRLILVGVLPEVARVDRHHFFAEVLIEEGQRLLVEVSQRLE